MNPEKIRKISSYPLRWRQWKHPQALLSSVDTPGRGFLLLSKYSIMQNAFIAAGGATPEQLPQELCICSKKNFQYKSEAKEVRQTFLTYFGEQYPELRNIKFGIAPKNMLTIARVRYKNRTLFAKVYNIHNCTLRFLEQCQTKIPETNRERREG